MPVECDAIHVSDAFTPSCDARPPNFGYLYRLCDIFSITIENIFMATETVKVTSSEVGGVVGQKFEIKKSDLGKMHLLKTMVLDLGLAEDELPEEAIPMPSVDATTLEAIVQWLRLHEDEEPRTEEHLLLHRLNRNVTRADVDLLDRLLPRSRLVKLINIAYHLDMPDLIDTLVKYTFNNLEGLTDVEILEWFDNPSFGTFPIAFLAALGRRVGRVLLRYRQA
uniref:Skp1_POZ domain-containing protein n=1 Tax=Steinernema glaseri TaxID=37863 RepID=A0A1I7Z283_9BILA